MPALYVDCRDHQVIQTADILTAIQWPAANWLSQLPPLVGRQAGQALQALLARMQRVHLSGELEYSSSGPPFPPRALMMDLLESLREAFKLLAAQLVPGRAFPVLVIDEAQHLARWLTLSVGTREAFTSFLTQVSLRMPPACFFPGWQVV